MDGTTTALSAIITGLDTPGCLQQSPYVLLFWAESEYA